jgi:hypothetical protein
VSRASKARVVEHRLLGDEHGELAVGAATSGDPAFVSFDFHKTYGYGETHRRVGRKRMQNHHPRIIHGHERTWVVECMECRNDTQSDLPIGIGMPLRDRETAERLRDNHSLRSNRVVAS